MVSLIFRALLSQSSYALHQAALEVGSLVFVPGAALGQAINHADHFGQKALSIFGFLQTTQALDGRAGGLFVKTILIAALLILTNALQ